jgi:hypothetical protein
MIGRSPLVAMKRLIEVLAAKSPDRSTLDELLRIIDDRDRWLSAGKLFDEIRFKYNKAARRGDACLAAQYDFEEACAKSLANFGLYVMAQDTPSCGFDPDAPFWILPLALAAARSFGIDEKEIIAAVLPD